MGVNNSAQDESMPLGVVTNPGTTPYGTNTGAPSIKPDDIDEWKGDQIGTVKNHFHERFKELKENYDKLVEDFNWNKTIYEADIMFKPVVGNSYHLYQRTDDKHEEVGSLFLSMVSKDEWGDLDEWCLNYIGTFKQDSTQKWVNTKLAESYEEVNG